MNIKKRLTALEQITATVDAGAWLAFIQADGSVELSHYKYGELRLPTRQAFDVWYKNNIIDDGRIRVFIVDIVNTQGKPPKEL